MMRIFGWALIIAGTLMFARTAWLGAMYFRNMLPISQMRFYVATPVSLVIVAAGIRILRRQQQYSAEE